MQSKLILLLIIIIACQSCAQPEFNYNNYDKLPKSRMKMIKKLKRKYNYKPYNPRR